MAIEVKNIDDEARKSKRLTTFSDEDSKRFIEFRDHLLNDRSLCRQHGIDYANPDMAQVTLVAYEYVTSRARV